MAAIILLLVCGWISMVNAQPVSLLPQDQTVCRGESISFNCIGSGNTMVLVSPPIVNETNSISLLPSDPVQSCPVVTNSAAAIVLVDSTGSPSRFMGTFTLYISPEQSEGQRTVSCRVSSADGMVTRNDTTFFVGSPSPITSDSLNPQVLGSFSENMMQVSVNLSWNSQDDAQEFMLQIMNSSYSTSIRSLESSVTVQLSYGTYSATLCAINRCGQECRDYPNIDIFRAEPPQTSQPPQPSETPQTPEEDNNDSLVIAPAVVAGVLGLLFIVTLIYAIVVTVIICTLKNDKLSAQTIPADEMKMK